MRDDSEGQITVPAHVQKSHSVALELQVPKATKFWVAHGRLQQGAGPRGVVGIRRCIYLKCKVSKEHYRSTNDHSPLLLSRGLRAAAARSTPSACQHLRVAEDPDESAAWKSPESYRTSLKANAEVYQATGQVVCERRTNSLKRVERDHPGLESSDIHSQHPRTLLGSQRTSAAASHALLGGHRGAPSLSHRPFQVRRTIPEPRELL